MDEESIINRTITPEGIAGIWMQSNMPNGGRKEQISLGTLIEGVLAEGIRMGKQEAIKKLNFSPTVSAATASLEADIIELERAIHKKNDDGVDFDVWSP
jgi:hypothetical protein